MKKLNYCLAGLALALIVSGCLNGAAPSKFESYAFDVKTNWFEKVVTNTVVKQVTNYVSITNTITVGNSNYVVVGREPQVVSIETTATTTNWTPAYDWTTSQKAKDAAGAAGAVGNLFGVPFVGAAMTAALSLWGWVRTSRQGKDMGAALAQVIETGREVLKQVPNGKQYDAAYVNFIQKHQTETGTIQQVGKILRDSLSPAEAKVAAQDIIDLVSGVTSSADRTASATPPEPQPPISMRT